MKRGKKAAVVEIVKDPEKPLKIDLGCGKNKKEGFVGVDAIAFEGVDIVMDIGKDPWPWKDGSVSEIHASHFLEHLLPEERIHFANEAFRVLKVGGTAQIIVPHWCASRAYGDLTHKWPPVSEFWFWYLNEEWRKVNAPHNQDYKCNFDSVWGYSMHPMAAGRSQDWFQFATTHYKEVCQDIIATLTKPGEPKKT